jgi:hypothetical protein
MGRTGEEVFVAQLTITLTATFTCKKFCERRETAVKGAEASADI